MIDFHCHLLPAIDDGSESIEESVEMASALQKAGFTTVYCTPHLMKGVYEANSEQVISSLDSLQQRLNKEDISLKLFSGREYYLDEFIFDYLKNPMPLGETNFVMLEIPKNIPLELIKETCFKIKLGGFIPMIAHPERVSIFVNTGKNTKSGLNLFNSEKKTESPDFLDYLIGLGCAFQGNLGSFLGVYGEQPQKTANILKKRGIYTHYGTDLHSRAGIKYLDRGLENWMIRGER
jgi:protein-tyrosine phosphatase